MKEQKYPPKKEVYMALLKKAEAFDTLMRAWRAASILVHSQKRELLGNETARKLWINSEDVSSYLLQFSQTMTEFHPEAHAVIQQMYPDEMIAIAVFDKVEEDDSID